MKTFFILILITLLTSSCSSLKNSEFCRDTGGSFTCIKFKPDKKFEYRYWIDIGKDKGVGVYEINKDQVVLKFDFPDFRKDFNYILRKTAIDTTQTIRTKKIRSSNSKNIRTNTFSFSENFIKILCIDAETKEVINNHRIIQYYGSFSGHFIRQGTVRHSPNDTLSIRMDTNLNFPIKIVFDLGGYLQEEIILDELSQYEVIAELSKNRGYNIISGQKVINRKYLIDKSKTELSDQALKNKQFYIKKE